MIAPTFSSAFEGVREANLRRVDGRVTQVVGLIVESNGPNARIGDLCYLEPEEGGSIAAEIVGFRGDRTLLMPLGELAGVRAGCPPGKLRADAAFTAEYARCRGG